MKLIRSRLNGSEDFNVLTSPPIKTSLYFKVAFSRFNTAFHSSFSVVSSVAKLSAKSWFHIEWKFCVW